VNAGGASWVAGGAFAGVSAVAAVGVAPQVK
jgi:hypothetical protein